MHEREFTVQDGTRVRIRRSPRRRRGATYQWAQGVLCLTIPGAASAAQEEDLLRQVLEAVRRKRRTPASDRDLAARAAELDRTYLEGRAQPRSVRWVGNQVSRWGSTTAAEGTVRLSSKLRGMPQWVIDGVLVHELSHLLADDGHGPRFRSWNERYPRHRESKAFLDGATWGMNVPRDGEAPDLAADA